MGNASSGSGSDVDNTEETSLTEQQIQWISASCRELEQQIGRETRLLDDIEAVLREYSVANPLPETFSQLIQSLEYLLDGRVVNLILTLVARSHLRDVVKATQERLTPEVWFQIRRMIALYGVRIRSLYKVSNLGLHSWKNVNSRVYKDGTTGEWSAFVELTKVNGDRIELDDRIDSLLLLVVHLLDLVHRVPIADGAVILSSDGGQALMRSLEDVSVRFGLDTADVEAQVDTTAVSSLAGQQS
jgi:hypothetical protein